MSNADRQTRTPRVLIADGEAIIAAAVGKLVEPACRVVGIVDDGCTLIEAALSHYWDRVRPFAEKARTRSS